MGARHHVERIHLDRSNGVQGVFKSSLAGPAPARPQSLPAKHELADRLVRERERFHVRILRHPAYYLAIMTGDIRIKHVPLAQH